MPQIRVFARLKPVPTSAINVLSDGVSVSTCLPDGKEAAFSFDRVFGSETGQEAVFQEVSELVQSALDGYQVSIHPDMAQIAKHVCYA